MAERMMPEYQELQSLVAADTTPDNMKAKLEAGPVVAEWTAWLFPEDDDEKAGP